MSSDSDSDICDVSTNVKKFMSKQKDEFWKTYKPPTDTPTGSFAVSDNEEDKDVVEVQGRSRVTRSNKRKAEQDLSEPKSTTPTDLVGKLNTLTENINEFMAEVGRGRRRTRKATRRGRSARGRFVRRSAEPPVEDLSTDEEPAAKEEPEDANPVVDVNVLWKSIEPKQFKVRKFDKLTCIFDYMARESGVQPELLYFTVDDKEVDLRMHSYVSLRLGPSTIIEGSVLPESYLERRRSNELRPEGLRFRVQCGGRKNLEVRLLPSDRLEVLYSRVANELNVDVAKLKLTFDGSLVKHDDTIAGLSLEENDIFDAVVT